MISGSLSADPSRPPTPVGLAALAHDDCALCFSLQLANSTAPPDVVPLAGQPEHFAELRLPAQKSQRRHALSPLSHSGAARPLRSTDDQIQPSCLGA
jgi:hypothetical protein